MVDGIPFLRVESEGLVAVALEALDAGARDDALVALLTNQDDWWSGPATDLSELRALVAERECLSLRSAMALLRLGPVADYFAYRWSDPTYLAGLALLEAHWAGPRTAFELACGIGHYLRELTMRGLRCVGADVVFAKCWLAKHWVCAEADYVVFDAAHRWPLSETAHFDLVQCHDAFYFLPNQRFVAAELRARVAPGGRLAISHLHNIDVEGGAKGPALGAEDWAALFPDAAVYDESELLAALIEARVPTSAPWSPDPAVEAWSVVEGAGPPHALTGGLALPRAAARLRLNPLLAADGGVTWPSARYAAEYAERCPWALPGAALPEGAGAERLRRMVDLPERW
ncbi:MAG: methyltransferase domain-containing protein [Sphingomonadaceae bacterium]|nr:methyltransferase domain-containing protein [Sphingomonadaceae bacterium]